MIDPARTSSHAENQGAVETDDYAVTAEFYDLWAKGHWATLAPSLQAAIASHIDPEAGSVVDLGAGSGWGTLAIADVVPDATILAVEPSRAMRTMLLSKVMGRPDVCARVTVVPCGFDAFEWPDRIGGFVAMGMLGHLTATQRRELWHHLATRLAPGVVAVIQLQSPARPVRVPLVRHSVVEIGAHSYEGWCSASPIGRRQLRWTLRCVVRHGDRVINEHTCTSDFRTVSAGDVRNETADAGLATVAASDGLVKLQHRADRRPDSGTGGER